VAWNTAWSGDGGGALRASERRLAGVTAELDDDITPEAVVGTPWKELAARSEELDLLVVGARAYGPLRRLLLGSTSTKLAHRSACPLLVAPRGAHPVWDAEQLADTGGRAH
jgi:nucleotide-binding universal stress UspA family protein